MARDESLSKTNLPADPPSYEDIRLSSAGAISPSSSNSPACSSGRSSTLNLSALRGAPEKKKNVPYRPQPTLQAQIDKLGELLLPLSPVSSGTKTEYFDLLPSFQMFQSILKRNDFEFDEGSLGMPPNYVAANTVSTASLPVQATTVEIDQVLCNTSLSDLRHLESDDDDDDANLERKYLFSDTESDDGLQHQARPTHPERAHPPFSNTRARDNSPATPSPPGANIMPHESYGHSVLDNIDMLPHAQSSKLSIEIFITKEVPVPHKVSAPEAKLKEYGCGDFVNGYVVITNNLDNDVDFGLFTVTLQGNIKLINKAKNAKGVLRTRSVIQKKILKMFDLNASYHESTIPSSAGIEYQPFTRDQHDGCVMGLPDNRILKAREKYKKFITFKFPHMLLDIGCPHGVMRHTMPPPSFGIDTLACYQRASTIEINKALGYGCLPFRGSPLKVKDYCFDEVSVSYVIRAAFIDKQHTDYQSHPVSTEDINDPQNKCNYIISLCAEFFLRLIPNVKSQVDSYSRAYSLFEDETFDSVGIDGVLYGRLAKRETWHFIKRMNLTVELEIQTALDKLEYTGDDLKRKYVGLTPPLHAIDSEIYLQITPEIDDFLPEFQVREFERRRVLFTQKPATVSIKKKKLLLQAGEKIGKCILAVKVPDKLIPYGSSRLFQKYNSGRDDDNVTKFVDIELWFKPDQNKKSLPEVSLVEFNVVSWSYKTDYPIPISFDHDFFYSRQDVSGAVVQHDDVENTKDNLQHLKDTINHYILFLRLSKIFISQNTYSYLKGLSNLGIKKDVLKDYFQAATVHSSDPNFEDWKPQMFSNLQTFWSKKMRVPLATVNKHNVTLTPCFQSCLVGRLYALQVKVKFKGWDDNHNYIQLDVPVFIG